MTDWYKDIFPCSACENGPFIGKKCRKGHLTKFVDGCHECGTLVNMKWYFWDEKCPDFVFIIEHDPSGS